MPSDDDDDKAWIQRVACTTFCSKFRKMVTIKSASTNLVCKMSLLLGGKAIMALVSNKMVPVCVLGMSKIMSGVSILKLS